jgi:KDO2-lipid IV(A) lauroyltransferase
MGCFEVAAQWYAQLHGPLTVLYSPPKRGLFSRLVTGGRAKPQLHLATPDLRGVRAMLGALKRKQAIAILPDQVPGHGEGQWAPFERLSWGRGYRCHGMAWPGQNDAAPLAEARELNQALEAIIRVCPEQYLWGYNRYKVPAGVAPPESLPSSSSLPSPMRDSAATREPV